MSLYHRIASTAVGHAAPARRPARALVCATRSTVRVRASSSQKATTATQTNSAVDVRSTRVARALAAPPKGVAAAARIRRFRADWLPALLSEQERATSSTLKIVNVNQALTADGYAALDSLQALTAAGCALDLTSLIASQQELLADIEPKHDPAPSSPHARKGGSSKSSASAPKARAKQVRPPPQQQQQAGPQSAAALEATAFRVHNSILAHLLSSSDIPALTPDRLVALEALSVQQVMSWLDADLRAAAAPPPPVATGPEVDASETALLQQLQAEVQAVDATYAAAIAELDSTIARNKELLARAQELEAKADEVIAALLQEAEHEERLLAQQLEQLRALQALQEGIAATTQLPEHACEQERAWRAQWPQHTHMFALPANWPATRLAEECAWLDAQRREQEAAAEAALQAQLAEEQAAAAAAAQQAQREAAALAAARASRVIKMQVAVKLETQPGQSVSLVGDHPALGSWDVGAALGLQWSEGHVWRATLDLPGDIAAVELKAVLHGTHGALWERGCNLKLALDDTDAIVHVSHDFRL